VVLFKEIKQLTTVSVIRKQKKKGDRPGSKAVGHFRSVIVANCHQSLSVIEPCLGVVE
jgi:hypothetical protein